MPSLRYDGFRIEPSEEMVDLATKQAAAFLSEYIMSTWQFRFLWFWTQVGMAALEQMLHA